EPSLVVIPGHPRRRGREARDGPWGRRAPQERRERNCKRCCRPARARKHLVAGNISLSGRHVLAERFDAREWHRARKPRYREPLLHGDTRVEATRWRTDLDHNVAAIFKADADHGR